MARIVVLGNALAAVVTLPFALPLRVGALDWAIVAFLGVFQIGVAYVLVLRGLRELRALEVSLLLAIEPVLNSLLSWAVHGERPGPATIAGSAIILAASASQIRRDTHATGS
jgi:drug/metabolite transporter, DME family